MCVSVCATTCFYCGKKSENSQDVHMNPFSDVLSDGKTDGVEKRVGVVDASGTAKLFGITYIAIRIQGERAVCIHKGSYGAHSVHMIHSFSSSYFV